ncbi:MAG TPA: lytic murein transglycosylase [Stellaceae bacterium]|jgi:membrane-bound lytic murein transglycosylase B|nr:lytic murein transglycosylase [Stellaceae bacterium]
MMPGRVGRRTLLVAPLLAAMARPLRALAADEDFAGFIAGVRRDAIAGGIRSATADYVLRGAQYLPHVIDLDRQQPEHTMTLAGFLQKVVTPQKTADGRAELSDNWPLLTRVYERFRVQPRFVVALWAVESDFGKVMGNYAVVSSLATLAFDGRRSSYFRPELIAALRIIDEGNVRPDAMLGSWAGAMGQCQFMPSTFLNFAVDFDGDGKRDIWGDRADVLGSIANYIAQLGWHGDQGWGRSVMVPANFDPRLVGLDTRRPAADWSRLGVHPADSAPLPAGEASLVMPDGSGGPALLVNDNFRAIMKWNKSTYFAAAVGMLADSFGTG